MRKKPYLYKLCAAGNDFIVIDNSGDIIGDRSEAAKRLCARRKGVGADGLILLERTSSKKCDIRMRIFNRDGSEAEMCGNGLRAAAWTSAHILKKGMELRFDTLAGEIRALVAGDRVKMDLYSPKDYRASAPLELENGVIECAFINTGVPHAVVFVDETADYPVAKLGGEIRRHPRFQPGGTNVNFVRIIDEHNIRVRTYERGVEGETPACGTGSTASAIVGAITKQCASPVTVHTKSGKTLTVSFCLQEESDVNGVILEGGVDFVFQARIPRLFSSLFVPPIRAATLHCPAS